MRKRPKKPVFHPTSIRLSPEMRDFLREQAVKQNRLNYHDEGDVTFIINEVLESYRAFIQKSKNKRQKVPA